LSKFPWNKPEWGRELVGVKFFLDDVPPHEFENTLLVISSGEGYSKKDITNRFEDRLLSYQKRFGSNTLGRMVDLGALQKVGNEYFLTTLGDTLKLVLSTRKNDFYDYVHYMHLQKAVEENARAYFWTYWLLCWYLGEQDGAWNSDEAAGFAMGQLQEKYEIDTLAIDKTTLGRVLRWVRFMSPNPIPKGSKRIIWRDNAPVRPFLLALDFYYGLKGLQYGYPILLTTEVRTVLRRITFLTESGLDGLINLGCKIFPGLRLHTSASGISIILDQSVHLEDLEAR
jgi:hypothetical protein